MVIQWICRDVNIASLRALDSHLKEKLITWLSPANLELHNITWDDPASLLEKIVAYEVLFFSSFFAFHVLYSHIAFLYKFFLCLGCASNKQSYRSEKKAGNRSPLLWVLPSSNTWLAIPFLVKELNSTHFSVYYCSQCLWIKISFSSLCGRTFSSSW